MQGREYGYQVTIMRFPGDDKPVDIHQQARNGKGAGRHIGGIGSILIPASMRLQDLPPFHELRTCVKSCCLNDPLLLR